MRTCGRTLHAPMPRTSWSLRAAIATNPSVAAMPAAEIRAAVVTTPSNHANAARSITARSITAAVMFPTTMFVRQNVLGVDIYGYHTLIVGAVGIAVFLIYRHRSNISRLLSKTENKFEKLHIIRFSKSSA